MVMREITKAVPFPTIAQLNTLLQTNKYGIKIKIQAEYIHYNSTSYSCLVLKLHKNE